MEDILVRIIGNTRRELAARRKHTPLAVLEASLDEAPPVRDFAAALVAKPHVGVIAEVKKASPSAGVIRADFDPVVIAEAYEAAGAACISVLTDRKFFQGDLAFLPRIRKAVGLPLLRKDFIVDPYQVVEARVNGADAVLLISEALDGAALRTLLAKTRELGMQALVESHDRAHLEAALETGARLVGINNRDLKSFEVSLDTTVDLAPMVPADCTLVSESGIRTSDDVKRLVDAGVKAILVGETLMRADDVTRALRGLIDF